MKLVPNEILASMTVVKSSESSHMTQSWNNMVRLHCLAKAGYLIEVTRLQVVGPPNPCLHYFWFSTKLADVCGKITEELNYDSIL